MLLALPLAFLQEPATPPKKPEPPPRFTVEQIRDAAAVVGLSFTPPQLTQMQKDVSDQLDGYERLWKLPLDNSVPPPFEFSPMLPGMKVAPIAFMAKPIKPADVSAVERPANLEDLAYADIPTLAGWIFSRKVSCVDLTRMYLARLKRLDGKLHMVVNLTEERALAQAAALDKELAQGRYRGLLHGIPWGAKDLLAVKGTPTTWGSKIFEHQTIDTDATVVHRLDEAGAILIAKLSLGEFAYGDLWFGGRTRNPWNPEQGSSGSSAGPAAATAAGCVAFAIGSETLGSIVSPCTRCGATGLRPTFGRVPRTGSMALSWTMDKLGPITRTVTDASIVLNAIQGPDGLDLSAFRYFYLPPGPVEVRGWKVGYVEKEFADSPDKHVLDELKELGVELVPIELPTTFPASDLLVILTCEAAAAFDELTRDGRDAQMVWQDAEAWPNTFRAARLVPAVEYLRASRLRTELMQEMNQVFQKVDLYVHPSFGPTLTLANLTGHPTICAPDGLDETTKMPRGISFTGRLYGETQLVALAQAWQRATRYHLAHPPL